MFLESDLWPNIAVADQRSEEIRARSGCYNSSIYLRAGGFSLNYFPAIQTLWMQTCGAPIHAAGYGDRHKTTGGVVMFFDKGFYFTKK